MVIMTNLDTKRLAEIVGDPMEYNLAVIVPPDKWIKHASDTNDLSPIYDSLPVLKVASGALGVLRALDLPGKMKGIQARLAETGEECQLWHLIFLYENGHIVGHDLHIYTFKVFRDEEARKWTF